MCVPGMPLLLQIRTSNDSAILQLSMCSICLRLLSLHDIGFAGYHELAKTEFGLAICPVTGFKSFWLTSRPKGLVAQLSLRQRHLPTAASSQRC